MLCRRATLGVGYLLGKIYAIGGYNGNLYTHLNFTMLKIRIAIKISMILFILLQ